MEKKGFKLVAFCTALLLLVTTFAGCGGTESNKETTTTASSTSGVEAKNYWEMLDSVQDTSDLPDWNGKQLTLVEWYAHGSGTAERSKATQDVVSPEIKRVTGVGLDIENSFDNGGNTLDVVLSLKAAADDWPHFIYSSTFTNDLIQELVTSGELYDLTELLPKYCPNIMKLFQMDKFPKVKENITAKGTDRIFFIPSEANGNFSNEALKGDPEIDWEKRDRGASIQPVVDWPRIWVRDDILKKMYPNAKTQDEIEALFMKNNKFTREEIFDVPIKSTDDFYQFMKDMKAFIDKEEIKENGRPVEVTFANTGGDNWPLMTFFLTHVNGMPPIDYFSYFSKTQGKIVRTIDQQWFKDDILEFQKLVREGIVSKESLLDNNAVFTEKLSSGHYAISYAWLKPDENALKEAGKTFRYRQLWLDIDYDFKEFTTIKGPVGNDMNIGIFKDKVSEEDLPQVLRYLDYMMSPVGEKLINWGPRSAGLFKEENGTRVYTDKELEDNMVYGIDNGRNVYYNIYNRGLDLEYKRCASPLLPIGAAWGKYHPKNTYDEIKMNVGATDGFFQPGRLPGLSLSEHQVVAEQNQSLTAFSDQWTVVGKARDAFEQPLTKTLAAKDDAEFEKLWQEMKEAADSIGMNESMFAEMNKIFFEKNPTYKEDAAKINKYGK